MLFWINSPIFAKSKIGKVIDKKQYIEEKYFENKKAWSAEPIDKKWKDFAVQVLEDYEQSLYKELKTISEFYSDASSHTLLYQWICFKIEENGK